MEINEREQMIYKDIANIINEIAFNYNIQNYYDVFCNTLNISRYINIKNIYCSDKSEVIVNILNAYIENDTDKLIKYINKFIEETVSIMNKEELKHLVNLLNIIYGAETLKELKFKSIEEFIEYNQKYHTERFNKLNKDDIKHIKLENKSYEDVNILPNSILLCYAPFEKQNIYEETFSFKRYIDWLKTKAQLENIILIIISPNIEDKDFIVYDYLQDKEYKNIIDRKRIHIYTNKDSILLNEKDLDF